jgi:hypothetical protein
MVVTAVTKGLLGKHRILMLVSQSPTQQSIVRRTASGLERMDEQIPADFKPMAHEPRNKYGDKSRSYGERP